ncbi:MAG TPA: hypothetical protein VIK14_16845 [Ignavibacteria bacterium]
MEKDLNDLKKSLESDIQLNRDLEKCVAILKDIIKDFDSISDKVQYELPKTKTIELLALASKSFKNNTLIGFNKRVFNFLYMKEINKQIILQEYKERNLINWEKLRKYEVASKPAIAWGVSKRRNSIPVFLDDEELMIFGYRNGFDKGTDFIKQQQEMYYDKEEFPPSFEPDLDKRWHNIRLTRGMQHQCIYLFENFFEKQINEKKMQDNETDNIAISLYQHPDLLELIFESVREIEKVNLEKKLKLERELLELYENLNQEKKDELGNLEQSELEKRNELNKIINEEKRRITELYSSLLDSKMKINEIECEKEGLHIDLEYATNENLQIFKVAIEEIKNHKGKYNNKYQLLFPIHDWFIETYIKNDHYTKKSNKQKKAVYAKHLAEVIEEETGKKFKTETIRKGYNRYLNLPKQSK